MADVVYPKYVNYICPICYYIIDNSAEKWEPRVLVPSGKEDHLQYAHKKCIDD